MTTLFVAWQDSSSRSWFPIGKLDAQPNNYEFRYTNGVLDAQKKCGFQGLQSFVKLDETYVSEELFAVFRNRVLPQSRPDYSEFVECLNLDSNSADPILVLTRSGGLRATDSLEVFPLPERTEDNKFIVHFFAHGIRYLDSSHQNIVESLKSGEGLNLVPEPDNAFDQLALQVHGRGEKLGYCPRYLNEDFNKLLKLNKNVQVTVEKVNQIPAPIQLRLLCKFQSDWPSDFDPFSDKSYQPLTSALTK